MEVLAAADGTLLPPARTRDARATLRPMTDRVVPRSWIGLRSWTQLERQRERGGLIVILDDATPSHFHAPRCDDVAQQHFETKKRNGWINGAYYWIADASDAAGYATACKNCGGVSAAPRDSE